MKNFKLFLAVIILFIRFPILTAQVQNNEYYLPGEWEPQSGILTSGLDDNVVFELVTQLSKEMKVYCHTLDSSKDLYSKKLSNAGANLENIIFISSPVEFSYAQRDGVMFLKNLNGEKKLVNFAWNCYGWYFEPEFKDYCEPDRKNRELYNSIHSKTFSFPVITSEMVNEGGAIESNGKGTILQVETLNMNRNPDMNLELQEAELKKVLNAKKVIWLKEGAAEDPFGWGTLITENYFGIGVKGHLDEFCRFVNENTILISFPDSAESEQDPVKKITLERMKVNYEILKNATDQDGKPFNIVKMPVPDVEYMTFKLDTTSTDDEIKFLSYRILKEHKNFSTGDIVHFVPASSYMNFLITNKTIYEAKYWTEGQSENSKLKDEKAKQILMQYFPERKVYQINTTETNHQGGGIHCWTMQIPE